MSAIALPGIGQVVKFPGVVVISIHRELGLAMAQPADILCSDFHPYTAPIVVGIWAAISWCLR